MGETPAKSRPVTRPGQYVLKLFVSGATPRSTAAVISVRALCEEHLQGRYDLEIIDLYQHPERARADQIVALPTLLREVPLPLLRLVGDMTNEGRVLQALGLPET